MANRRFYQFALSYYPLPVVIDGYIAFGAGGQIKNGSNGVKPVPPNVDGYTGSDGNPLGVPRGITSIVHNATGDYTLNLEDTFTQLRSCQLQMVAVDAASSPTALDVEAQVYSWNVTGSTQADGVAKQTVNILFFTPGTTTKVDPPAGTGVLVEIRLRNSDLGT